MTGYIVPYFGGDPSLFLTEITPPVAQSRLPSDSVSFTLLDPVHGVDLNSVLLLANGALAFRQGASQGGHVVTWVAIEGGYRFTVSKGAGWPVGALSLQVNAMGLPPAIDELDEALSWQVVASFCVRPDKLIRNLPDAYDTRTGSNLSKLLCAFGFALRSGEDAVARFVADTSVVAATDEQGGASRVGANYNVPRPIGITSATRYLLLVRTIAGIRRGTLHAIEQVLRIATGIEGIEAFDKQQQGHFFPSIPPFEIWISIPFNGDGAGFHWDYPTNTDGDPVESGLWGDVYAPTDEWGGRWNDHWWGEIDYWTQELVDSVRLAGTIIIYKAQ
jgi:hypothetical protein